jgi:putative aminopeptidase FrvX
MDESRIAFLQQLLEAPSPSGFEQPAQAVVRRDMERYADEVQSDVIGNSIGVLNAGGSPRVMLAGHCDEIGFMVRYINDEGFVYFSPIGGVDRQIARGERVVIHDTRGPVRGIIMDARTKVPEFHEMWIDIGARNKAEAEARVAVCDPVTFAAGFERMGEDLAVCRALDDKLGVFVVAEVLRLLAQDRPKAAVFSVATAQEEVSGFGAATSVYRLKPDVGIAVEVWFSSDAPGVDKLRVGESSLGKGPILYRGANINPIVADLLEDTAQAEGIAYQMIAAPGATGTDANPMQVSRAGVATALIAVPQRYMHTPVEVVCLSDVDNTSKLLAAFIKRLEPGMSFIPM